MAAQFQNKFQRIDDPKIHIISALCPDPIWHLSKLNGGAQKERRRVPYPGSKNENGAPKDAVERSERRMISRGAS